MEEIVFHYSSSREEWDNAPKADEGQIHHNPAAQSKDKGWRGSLWWSAAGRMLRRRLRVGGTVRRERKVLGVKSRASLYAVPVPERALMKRHLEETNQSKTQPVQKFGRQEEKWGVDG
ncbi:unnamed protein product [Pleuronectes platessa]|uniref:Uncharacterized protein n=1 Tax=Pleuronectes platessa TaxID=8262 RepID=A0A9N7URI6_PLEPL|nr:unnamed protein product [Pleuronectes platessa]